MDPDGMDGRSRHAWEANAGYWDARMGEGNEFFEAVVWPATERLLELREHERWLDVACGNGLTSRRLARAGAEVVAVDFSETLIALARQRSSGMGIDYHVLDATHSDALRALGEGSFDGALCNMALMDMSEHEPLLHALSRLLRPAGRFVLSVMHPCFNNPAAVQMGELEDREGEIVTTYSVKVSRYLTPFVQPGLAMHGQPVPHPYFHRSLTDLLEPAFRAGFVVDALRESAFPPEHEGGATPLSWSGRFSEIPPVLIVRLRKEGR